MSPHYETGNPWTDGYNMVVLGGTQTGKTSAMRELHHTSDRVSIWLNAAGKDRVEDIPGYTVQSVDDVQKAFAEDRYAIELLSRDRQADLVELREWLWAVADRTDRRLPMQLIVDEAQDVAPQSGKAFGNFPSRDDMRRLAKKGVKRNIKSIAITQDPTALDKQALRQTEYRLVFRMAVEARQSSAVSPMGFDWDAVDAGDRYTGALFDQTGEVLDDDVKAEARYA